MSNTSPVSSLLLSMEGLGEISNILIKHLIDTQNSLIEKNLLLRKANGPAIPKINVWQSLSKIDVIKVDREKQVEPLLISTCPYEMDLQTKSGSIKYNYDLLQHQISNEWIEGCSLLEIDNSPTVNCMDDTIIKSSLNNLDIKQKPLSPHLIEQISHDCKQLNEVYDCLQNLETAVGYVKNVHINSSTRIYSLFENLGLIKDFFPNSAKENCFLENIVDFWHTLCRERSKLLVENDLFVIDEQDKLSEEQSENMVKNLETRNNFLEFLIVFLHKFIYEKTDEDYKEYP